VLVPGRCVISPRGDDEAPLQAALDSALRSRRHAAALEAATVQADLATDSFSVWDHGLNECWLKHQEDPANAAVNHRGAYAASYRAEHKTAPERVAWMAGVLLI